MTGLCCKRWRVLSAGMLVKRRGAGITQQLVQINVQLAGQIARQPRQLSGRILLQGTAVAIGDSQPDQSQGENADQGKCQ